MSAHFSAGIEVERRVPEWDRRIDNLDHQEVALHHQQNKLLRDQVSTFVRDLDSLRAEVAGLRSKQDSDRETWASTLKDELQILQTQVEPVDKLVAYVDELKVALQRDITERMQFKAGQTALVERLLKLEGQVGASGGSRAALHTELQERLNYIEQVMGESAEATAESAGILKSKVNELDRASTKIAERLDMFGRSLEVMRESTEATAQSTSALKSKANELDRANIKIVERLDMFGSSLEVMGQSAEATAQSTGALKSKANELDRAHVRIAERLDVFDSTLEALKNRKEGLHKVSADAVQTRLAEDRLLAFSDRLEYLESSIGDSAAKHASELQAVKSKHDRELESMKNAHHAHASMVERLDYLEKVMGESSDKHGAELDSLKRQHTKFGDLHSKHAKALEALTAAQAHHASFVERLDYLEQRLGESADEHHQKVEALKSAHAKASEMHSQHAKELDTLKSAQAHHGTVVEKVDSLEARFKALMDKQSAEMESLKRVHAQLGDAHTKHTRGVEAHHATVEERLVFLERLLGESADKQGAELGTLKAAHLKHAKELDAARQSHLQQHATLVQRVEHLEKDIHESFGKQVAELESLRASCFKHGTSQNKLSKEFEAMKATSDQHAIATERLEQMQHQLEQGSTAMSGQLQAIRSKVDLFERRLTSVGDIKSAHDRLVDDVRELRSHVDDAHDKQDATAAKLEHVDTRLAAANRQSSELKRAEAVSSPVAVSPALGLSSEMHDALLARVSNIEGSVGDSHARHAADLEALRLSQDRHAKALGTLQATNAQHSTLAERIESLERNEHELASKHVSEIGGMSAKLDHLQSRVVALEGLDSVVGELRSSYSRNELHKSAHATLQERVDSVENALAKVADKNTTKLDQICAKQEELAREASGLRHDHANVQQRLENLSQEVSSSQEDSIRALDSLKSGQSGSAKTLEAMQKRLAGQAATGDRVERLERQLEEATAKHAQESSLNQTKYERVQNRIQACETQNGMLGNLQQSLTKLNHDTTALQEQQASLKDVLESLRSTTDESMRKFVKDVQVQCHSLERLQTRVQSCEKQCAQVLQLEQSHAALAAEKGTLQQSHSTLKERLAYVEKLIGDSADAHKSELQALADSHTSLASDTKASHSKHAGLVEQLSAVERRLRDLTHKHDSEFANLDEKCEHLQHELAAERRVREGHTESIDGLKRSQAKGTIVGKDAFDQHAVAINDRFGQVERSLQDFGQKHMSELENVKAENAKLKSDLRNREQHYEALTSHVGQLKSDTDNSSVQHAGMKERLDYLERLLGDSADRHAAHVEAVMDANGKNARELDNLWQAVAAMQQPKLSQHQASLPERMDRLEQGLADVAGKQSKDAATTHSNVQELHHRLTQEQAAREAHRREMQEHLTQERKAAEARVLAAHQNLQELQEVATQAAQRQKSHLHETNDAQSKMAMELEEHRELYERLTDHVKSLERRLMERDGDPLYAQFATRLSACESSNRTVSDSVSALQRRGDGLEMAQGVLGGRVDHVERLQEGNLDQITKVTDGMRAADAKVSADLKSLCDAQQTTAFDRIGAMERENVEDRRRSEEEVRSLNARLDKLSTRISSCESQAAALSDIRRSQASVAHEAAAFATQSATLGERISELESAFGSAAERQVSQAGVVESSLIKVEQLQHRMSTCESSMDTFSELLRQPRSPSSPSAESAAILARRNSDFERIFEALDKLEAARRQQDHKDSQSSGQLNQLRDLLDGKVDKVEVQRLRETIRSDAVSAQQHGALQSRILQLEAVEAGRGRGDSSVVASSAVVALRSEVAELRDRVAADTHFQAQLEGVLERQEQQIRQLLGADRKVAWERDLGQVSGGRGPGFGAVSAAFDGEEFNGKLKALQRNVNNNETLILREIEDRQKEARRLWDAIDTHTHDLSSPLAGGVSPTIAAAQHRRLASSSRSPKIGRVQEGTGGSNEIMDDSYLPFPCQPLTSFLRIGSQGASAVDSDGDIASPPRRSRGSAGFVATR